MRSILCFIVDCFIGDMPVRILLYLALYLEAMPGSLVQRVHG
jgi:hypothetical protein